MEIRLLGPVELSDGSSSLRLPGLKLRTILATLALTTGKTVTTDELIDELWGEDPPANARNALQAHIVRLRKILRDRLGEAREVLQTSPSGYFLNVPDKAVDIDWFTGAVTSAQQARSTSPVSSAELLSYALSLWRGPALLDVGEGVRCRVAAVRLDEMRLMAQVDRIDIRISMGLHESAVPDLEQLVGRYPLRERICERLMVALYRCGRQSDALDAYRRLRQRLDADLGLAPGPALQARLTQILNHDPALAPPVRHRAFVPDPVADRPGDQPL